MTNSNLIYLNNVNKRTPLKWENCQLYLVSQLYVSYVSYIYIYKYIYIYIYIYISYIYIYMYVCVRIQAASTKCLNVEMLKDDILTF